MPYDVFAALVLFVFVTAFTPGPNNIMVTASGVNFGFLRTVPHMAGITVGFVVLVVAAAAGLGAVFAAAPGLQTVLKIAGALYMLWLAWKVANSRPADNTDVDLGSPMTFWEALAFQWVNPKAVVMALTVIAIYVRPEHRLNDVLIVLAVEVLATVGTVVAWTGFGVALRGLLADPRHARTFNIVMALLLVVSIVPMLL
ncbi:lysine transporter LysE [Pseudolabrys sp. Root1462]|uniref:LysE family translocator n=1 Tax=Pseudolabrys sp. Root1462 TaxID=1736466 RepID=UPI000703804B|nr:LysE family translocator [Pseudolabrys sp. Root1462]KQZ00080.1 lysine transporter LysE [Pseudolabrys sp. Root1462]